jgi:hypothetical protein
VSDTALSCGWFATMELLLRHDGFVWRALLAAGIAADGVFTIAVCEDLVDATAALRHRAPGSSPRTWRDQVSRRNPISKATCCSSAWR